MAVATATKSADGGPDTKHNIEAVRQGYLRPDRQEGHGAVVEGHGLGGHQGAGDALPAPCLAL